MMIDASGNEQLADVPKQERNEAAKRSATGRRIRATEEWQDNVDVQVGRIPGGWQALVSAAQDGE